MQDRSVQIVTPGLEPLHDRSVVYFWTVVAGERGRCDVRGLGSGKLLISKAFRPGTIRPTQYSAKFPPLLPYGVQKLWAKSHSMSGEIAHSNRSSRNATYVGKIPATFFSYERARLLHSCEHQARGGENTLAYNAHLPSSHLHSKVTNPVLKLANTGSPFVTFESRLVAALGDSGGVEASLAGKALQFRFGLTAHAQRPTRSVAAGFEISDLHRRRDLAGRRKKAFSFKPAADRRGEGVGWDGRRRV